MPRSCSRCFPSRPVRSNSVTFARSTAYQVWSPCWTRVPPRTGRSSSPCPSTRTVRSGRCWRRRAPRPYRRRRPSREASPPPWGPCTAAACCTTTSARGTSCGPGARPCSPGSARCPPPVSRSRRPHHGWSPSSTRPLSPSVESLVRRRRTSTSSPRRSGRCSWAGPRSHPRTVPPSTLRPTLDVCSLRSPRRCRVRTCPVPCVGSSPEAWRRIPRSGSPALPSSPRPSRRHAPDALRRPPAAPSPR